MVSLELLGKISLQVKRQLIEIFRICNKDIKLNIAFKSFVTMSSGFRFKNQIRKCLNSVLLYKSMRNTCKSVYIGKTKRYYLVRQFEHQNHFICTDNFKITGNSVSNYYLRLKQLLLISKNSNHR